jgi:hypothetical protein
MIFGGDMPRVNDYIIRKNGKYYIGRSGYEGHINKAMIFKASDVEQKELWLDRDDELLAVNLDGSFTITEYNQRKPF